MNKIQILVVIVLLIFGYKAITDALPVSKSIDIAGDYATIRYGNMFIKAKMAPEVIEDFWVNNAFEDKKSDGWFWVIPAQQVRTLKAAYGDFTRCDSPGASAARENLQLMRVFTTDLELREKIRTVIKRVKSFKESLTLEIKGSKLEIEEHLIGTKEHFQSYQNKPENFVYIGPVENYYLVKDIFAR